MEKTIQEKTIEGYEDYIITSEGDVYSTKWGKRKKLRPALNAKGYRRVRLYQSGAAKAHRVCRLVAKHFVGSPRTGQVADHIDGIRHNDTVGNLRWVSNTKNVQNGASAALTPEIVKKLRTDLLGMPAELLGTRYGVHPRTIRDAREGRTWANL